MKHFRVILIIGVIEILIGGLTICGNILTLALSINEKPYPVLCFVFVAGILSTLIGVGILRFNKLAYRLLLYFSEFIILSKILILLGVFELGTSVQTSIPPWTSSIISIAYHGYVIAYLKREAIKKLFHWH